MYNFIKNGSANTLLFCFQDAHTFTRWRPSRCCPLRLLARKCGSMTMKGLKNVEDPVKTSHMSLKKWLTVSVVFQDLNGTIFSDQSAFCTFASSSFTGWSSSDLRLFVIEVLVLVVIQEWGFFIQLVQACPIVSLVGSKCRNHFILL